MAGWYNTDSEGYSDSGRGLLTHLKELVTHSDSSPGCGALLGHPRDEYALKNEGALNPRAAHGQAQQPQVQACRAAMGLDSQAGLEPLHSPELQGVD